MPTSLAFGQSCASFPVGLDTHQEEQILQRVCVLSQEQRARLVVHQHVPGMHGDPGYDHARRRAAPRAARQPHHAGDSQQAREGGDGGGPIVDDGQVRIGERHQETGLRTERAEVVTRHDDRPNHVPAQQDAQVGADELLLDQIEMDSLQVAVRGRVPPGLSGVMPTQKDGSERDDGLEVDGVGGEHEKRKGCEEAERDWNVLGDGRIVPRPPRDAIEHQVRDHEVRRVQQEVDQHHQPGLLGRDGDSRGQEEADEQNRGAADAQTVDPRRRHRGDRRRPRFAERFAAGPRSHSLPHIRCFEFSRRYRVAAGQFNR